MRVLHRSLAPDCRVCMAHVVVRRISRSCDWDRMVRLWAGSLGRVSDRETKYLEDDRCRRSSRFYYREPYLSWLERCDYSFHRLFHWIINTRRPDSFDVLRSLIYGDPDKTSCRFSVANIKCKMKNHKRKPDRKQKKMQMPWCNLLLAKIIVFTFLLLIFL